MSANEAKRKNGKGPNPQIVFGVAILILVAGAIFVYFAKQRQNAYYAEHPSLTHYVLADDLLIDFHDQALMEETLAKLDKDGAAQMIVVANDRLQSGAIADEALQIGRRYGIGHAGRNDGVVLLIAAQEKKARIEVGYGLEGVLTDAQSRLIIANEIEPYLAKGDVSGAARHSVDAIMALVHPAPFAEPVAEQVGIGGLVGILLFLLIPVLIVVGVIQRILLAIPATRRHIEASKRWSWLARARIITVQSSDDDEAARRDDDDKSRSTGSSPSSISGGGSFGGGGANN